MMFRLAGTSIDGYSGVLGSADRETRKGEQQTVNIKSQHKVTCTVIVPSRCHLEMTAFTNNRDDAIRIFRNSGWHIREEVWLCPVCVTTYDAKQES